MEVGQGGNLKDTYQKEYGEAQARMEKERTDEPEYEEVDPEGDPHDLPTESAEIRTRRWLIAGGSEEKEPVDEYKATDGKGRKNEGKGEQTREEGVEKRGRPANVERLRRERERDRSGNTVSIASWLTKRRRESDSQDSDSEKEEREGKRKKIAKMNMNSEHQ